MLDLCRKTNINLGRHVKSKAKLYYVNVNVNPNIEKW